MDSVIYGAALAIVIVGIVLLNPPLIFIGAGMMIGQLIIDLI